MHTLFAVFLLFCASCLAFQSNIRPYVSSRLLATVKRKSSTAKSRKKVLPTVVELNTNLSTALLEVVVPGDVSRQAFCDVYNEYLEDNNATSSKGLPSTYVDMFTEYGDSAIREMCLKRLLPHIEKLCNQSELVLFGPHKSISVVDSLIPVLLGQDVKVRAEFDILPEVEYLNQGYKGLEINITTPDSVEDLLFHYWKTHLIKKHTLWVPLSNETRAGPGHQVIYQKTLYEVLSDGSRGDRAKSLPDSRKIYKCEFSEFVREPEEREKDEEWRGEEGEYDEYEGEEEEQEEEQGQRERQREGQRERQREAEAQWQEEGQQQLSEVALRALMTPSYTTTDRQEWRDLTGLLLGARKGDNFTFATSDVYGGTGRRLLCEYRVVSVNMKMAPEWDGELAKRLTGRASVYKMEKEMSIHIAPLLLEHLETQPKDALASALLKNCRLKGPVPLSFLLSVADRQQRWHPSKKAKEYLAAWRRRHVQEVYLIDHLREVQQLMRQKYLDLDEEQNFENLVRLEVILRDIHRREQLQLSSQQKKDAAKLLSYLDEGPYWKNIYAQRVTTGATFRNRRSDVAAMQISDLVFRFIARHARMGLVDAHRTDLLSDKVSLAVVMPNEYLEKDRRYLW